MQLKMLKPFNQKLVQQLLKKEDEFISNIFSIMPISKPEPGTSLENLYLKNNENTKDKICPTYGEKTRATSFEELQAKLDKLKNIKKLNYKEKLLKKGLKKRMKKKTKKEERIMQKKIARTEQMTSGSNRLKAEDSEIPKIPKPKPVFNSEGKMVFSKFDFSEIGTKKRLPQADKDPKKILQKLEHKKEKLKELKETGETEKIIEMKEKDAWQSVLARASGEKVKDDPELLKKTLKRKQQQKAKSSQKWQSRLDNVDKSKKERQDKRQENIMKRKKDKKLNKLKKASKKGRVIPGL